MKNINRIFFADNKYKEKIYSVTHLRLLSFEIYKLFLLYISILIINKLSHFFPVHFFFEINFNFFSIIKIFIYLLIIDICYFILFESNTGIKSFHEFIINLIFHPDIKKLISMSLSFCLIFFCTKEFESLMPRLDLEYIRKKYDSNNNDDEDNETYNEYDRYNYADFFYLITTSGLIFLYMVYYLGKFDAWPKLNLSRINNFKNKLVICFINIGIIGLTSFFIIYIILIFFYRTLFVFDLSLNYTSLFVLEYNIFFLSLNCFHNFICAPVNYITNEISTPDKLIQKEINFLKENNFYIGHHLQHIRDLYEYPRDIKFNTNLLLYDNLKYLKKKINIFLDSIDKKYQKIYTQKNNFYINSKDDLFYKVKTFFGNIIDFFDFKVNQVIEKETCVQNIKFLIEIIGNVITFISDAKINKVSEDKYNEYKDYSYYFVDKLIDMDSMLINLLKNKRLSENMKKSLQKLRYIIKNYFEVIRYKQMKNKFMKLISQKIQAYI